MTLRPEFFDIYLELAVEFRLPDPAAVEPSSERDAGFPFRQLAADEGVVFPDHFLPARRAGSRARVEKAVHELQPGVTEIHVQPAVDTPEVRAMSPSWSAWVDDHALVTDGSRRCATHAGSGRGGADRLPRADASADAR